LHFQSQDLSVALCSKKQFDRKKHNTIMGKGAKQQTQKKRLEGGSTSGFIGFSAFAAPVSTTTNFNDDSSTKATPASSSVAGGARPNPVYTGTYSLLRATFAKLKKKDPITKVKALSALCTSSDEDGIFNYSDAGRNNLHQDVPKHEVIQALGHFSFLFHNVTPAGAKLYPHNGCLAYDNTASVRVATLQVWVAALKVVPKAAKFLLLFSMADAADHTNNRERGALSNLTVMGTIYSLCYDSSREVSSTAKALLHEIMTTFSSSQKEIQDAIMAHLIGIMVQVKPPPSASSSGGDDDSAETFAERYVRSVLSALDAMSQFVQQYPEMDTSDNDDGGSSNQSYLNFLPMNNPKRLWKHIANPQQPAFRNATYRLVSACVQYAPTVIDYMPDSASQQPLVATLLQTAISFEKSPNNPNVLLESLVLYLRYLRKTMSSVASSGSFSHDQYQSFCDSIAKSLSNKQFRKACHGCPPRLWCPLLLPLLAALPPNSEASQLKSNIVLSVWEGMEHSHGDGISIVMAISECTTYFLSLKESGSIDQQASNDDIHDNNKKKNNTILDLFFKAFNWYLAECPTLPERTKTMAERLAKDWSRLSVGQQREMFMQLNTSRMTELSVSQVTTENGTGGKQALPSKTQRTFESKLVTFLQLVRQKEECDHNKKDGRDNNRNTNSSAALILLPGLSVAFDRICTCRKGLTPSLEDLSCLLEIVQFCGVSLVLNEIPKLDNASLENDFQSLSVSQSKQADDPVSVSLVEPFVMNALLQWTIVLGREEGAKGNHQREESITLCFTLLHLMLDTFEEARQQKHQVWEAFVKELIKAKCHLGAFTLGLQTMSSLSTSAAMNLQCLALDRFATEVGVSAEEIYLSSLTRTTITSSLRNTQTQGANDDTTTASTAIVLLDQQHALELDQFLRVCVGLLGDDQHRHCLVGHDVVTKWVASCCSDRSMQTKEAHYLAVDEEFEDGSINASRDILLDVLVAASSSSTMLKSGESSASCALAQEELGRIFLETWFRGGHSWQRMMVMDDSSSFAAARWKSIVARARGWLKNDLSSKESPSGSGIALESKRWAARAKRLLVLSQKPNLDINEEGESRLGLVHLEDGVIWSQSRRDYARAFHLSERLFALLRSFNTAEERRQLLLGKNDMNETSSTDSSSWCIHLVVQIIQTCLLRRSSTSSSSMTTTSDLDSLIKSNDRGRQLISLLGGVSGLGETFMEKCCNEIITSLSLFVKQPVKAEGKSRDPATIPLKVQALDFMVGAIGREEEQHATDEVDAFAVKKGDRLSYVVKKDGQESGELREVIISKVHDEDLPDAPYFSIRDNAERSGDAERQTVASRLRRLPGSNTGIVTAVSLVDPDIARRLEDRIVSKVAKPALGLALISSSNDDNHKHNSVLLLETLHTAITKCGLSGAQRGIGSVRHDVFTMVTKLDTRTKTSVQSVLEALAKQLHETEENKNESQNLSLKLPDFNAELEMLSLIMGGGRNTEPGVANSFGILKYDPIPQLSVLCDLLGRPPTREKLNETSKGEKMRFVVSVSKWIAVSVTEVNDDKIIKPLCAALDTLADVGLGADNATRSMNVNCSIAQFQVLQSLSKAISLLFNKVSSLGGDAPWLPIPSSSNMAECFLRLAPQDCHNISHGTAGALVSLTTDNEQQTPEWQRSFFDFLRIAESVDGFLSGSYVEQASACLFQKNKHWFAFQLLHLLIQNGMKRMGARSTSSVIDAECQKALQIWSQSLPEEESEELEEDVEIACSIIPAYLTTQLISWHGDELQDDSGNTGTVAMGRFLSWLTLLDLLDSFDQSEARKRGALLSFLQQTKAGAHILSLALLNMPLRGSGRSRKILGGDRHQKVEWMSCTSLGNAHVNGFDIEHVATLVMFRTVQSLPTLAKLWWTDDCHRSMKDYVKVFVEELVAPETLKLQLERIQGSHALEEMDVSGSSVAREVVAVYEQDEVRKHISSNSNLVVRL
jgi:hypothetical protein